MLQDLSFRRFVPQLGKIGEDGRGDAFKDLQHISKLEPTPGPKQSLKKSCAACVYTTFDSGA